MSGEPRLTTVSVARTLLIVTMTLILVACGGSSDPKSDKIKIGDDMPDLPSPKKLADATGLECRTSKTLEDPGQKLTLCLGADKFATTLIRMNSTGGKVFRWYYQRKPIASSVPDATDVMIDQLRATAEAMSPDDSPSPEVNALIKNVRSSKAESGVWTYSVKTTGVGAPKDSIGTNLPSGARVQVSLSETDIDNRDVSGEPALKMFPIRLLPAFGTGTDRGLACETPWVFDRDGFTCFQQLASVRLYGTRPKEKGGKGTFRSLRVESAKAPYAIQLKTTQDLLAMAKTPGNEEFKDFVTELAKRWQPESEPFFGWIDGIPTYVAPVGFEGGLKVATPVH